MTERFEILFLPKALKALKQLHPSERQRIVLATEALRDEPYPAQSQKIVGPADLFRIRVGDYRIVYTVKDAELIIVIITLGHRRDVYRGIGG